MFFSDNIINFMKSGKASLYDFNVISVISMGYFGYFLNLHYTQKLNDAYFHLGL